VIGVRLPKALRKHQPEHSGLQKAWSEPVTSGATTTIRGVGVQTQVAYILDTTSTLSITTLATYDI
jgi:hypothetical protein